MWLKLSTDMIFQNHLPFLKSKKSVSNSTKDKYEGYIVDLVDAVSEIAGLDYTLNDENANYSAMVSDLVENKTDLVVADFSMTEERANIIDFSIPFLTGGLTIVMKKPSKSDPAPFSFMSPFSVPIWVLILSAYVTVSCILAVVTR